jgi:putative tricarboxylic transport membrane protein
VRRDLLTSLVLIALGAGVVVEAMRMPRYDHLGINPYTVPGIVPGFLGAILAVFGVLMLARTAIAWRRHEPVPTTAADDEPGSVPRVLFTLALTLGYGGLLVGNLPFWLATGIFVWAFLLVFEWRPRYAAGAGAAVLWRTGGTALLEAVLVSAAVTFVFQRVFLVTLP